MRALKNLSLCSLLLLFAAAGCDKVANPIAPSGSVLSITASPTQISLTGNGSLITISGIKPDGNPLSSGTLIQLSTDRGTLRPNSSAGCASADTAARIEVGSAGQATALLCGNGQSGAATVTARLVNSAEGEVSIAVQIGADATTQPTLVLRANPTTIATGDSSIITILARGPDGSPLGQGQRIRLIADLGTVACNSTYSCSGLAENPCAAVCTDQNSEALATYTSGDRSGTGVVSALVGTSELQMVNITINAAVDTITLSANPNNVDRNDTGETVNLEALVIDANGTPLNNVLVRFTARAGSDENGQPIGQFNSSAVQTNQGSATTQLVVTRMNLSNIPAGGFFTVRAEATSEGSTARASTIVTVNGTP